MGQTEYIYGMRRVYSGLPVSISPRPVEYIALSNRVYLFVKRSICPERTKYIRWGRKGYLLPAQRIFIGDGNSIPAWQRPYPRKEGTVF
jgi:hypothetical protein